MTGGIVEVETRIPLDGPDTLEKVERFLSSYTVKRIDKRLLIDYSTFLEGIGTRKKDVRVRITNGDVQVVVKLGTFGGRSRQEAIINVANSDLLGAVTTMAFLGYTKGVAALRRISRFDVGEAEFALTEVVNFSRPEEISSRFLEVEITCEEEEKASTEERVDKLVRGELGVEPFSVDEWNRYIGVLNETANGVFDFEKDDPAGLLTVIESI